MFSFQYLAEFFFEIKTNFPQNYNVYKCVQAKFHRREQPSKNGNHTLKIANGQEGLLILMVMS